MELVSRQQRRSFHRDLVKLGRAALATGLSPQPKREVVLGVALLIKAKLRERNNPRRASDAAGMALGLVEKSLAARPPAAAIVCRKGCAYCCYTFVGVTAPEVFRLADAVRARHAVAASTVQERCRPLQGLGPQDRIGRKLACPLLEEGACTVYRDRPMVCRQTTSLSLDACIDEFEGRNTEAQIPISPLHLAHVGNVHIAMLAALKAEGLPSSAYELSSAIDIALSVPDAESRWLAGDDVFRALPPVERTSAGIDAVADRIAREIAG